MKRISWLLLIVAAALAGASSGRFFRTAAPAVAIHSLVISPNDLNFGEVWQQDRFVWPITIHNLSETSKVIRSVEGSCTCQSFSPSSFELKPGESRTVVMTIKLQSKTPTGVLLPLEEFTASIWAFVQGERKPIGWTLRGQIKHVIRYPSHIELGRISEYAPGLCKRTVPLFPLVELEELRVRSESKYLKVDVSKAANRYELTVEPLDRNRFNGILHIELTPIARGGQVMQKITIPVRLEVGSDTLAIPEVMNIGYRKPTEVVRETLNVQSISGRKLSIENISHSNDVSILEVLQDNSANIAVETQIITSNAPNLRSFGSG